MNFLAHLYLSPPAPAPRIGNLLPDLVRGPMDPAWDRDVLQGARNHRRVDAFTDTHPLFARSKQRVFAAHGRFSGIVVDMLYDHFLARDWTRYHPLPLRAFAGGVYRDLASHLHLMPEPMPGIVGVMARQDWLCAYADPAGLALTLERMSRRFSQRFNRAIDLAPAAGWVDDPALTDDFHTFFPQLIRYVGGSPAADTHTPGARRRHDSFRLL